MSYATSIRAQQGEARDASQRAEAEDAEEGEEGKEALMTSMLFDEHGNALDAFPSLREGIRGLRRLCEADPTAREGVVLMVYDKEGVPLELLAWEDINVE